MRIQAQKDAIKNAEEEEEGSLLPRGQGQVVHIPAGIGGPRRSKAVNKKSAKPKETPK